MSQFRDIREPSADDLRGPGKSQKSLSNPTNVLKHSICCRLYDCMNGSVAVRLSRLPFKSVSSVVNNRTFGRFRLAAEDWKGSGVWSRSEPNLL